MQPYVEPLAIMYHQSLNVLDAVQLDVTTSTEDCRFLFQLAFDALAETYIPSLSGCFYQESLPGISQTFVASWTPCFNRQARSGELWQLLGANFFVRLPGLCKCQPPEELGSSAAAGYLKGAPSFQGVFLDVSHAARCRPQVGLETCECSMNLKKVMFFC